MAGKAFTIRRLAAATVLAVGLTGSPAPAQSDPLDRVKAQRQIADQKAEATVKDEFEQADKLARAHRQDVAVKRLKQLIVSLDLSADVSSEKRAELVKLIQDKIATVEGRSPATPQLDPKLAGQKEALRKALEAAQAEAKDVKEGVAEIEKLHQLGRAAQAGNKVAELARKYPNNPSVIALIGQGSFGEKVAAARDLAKEQADRIVYAMNDLANSAMMPRGDQEFPKDFKEKGDRLRKNQPPLIGPDEEAILVALEKKIPKGVKDAPFEEVLQGLSNLIDKPIYLDKKSLEDAGMDLKRPVSIPDNVSARTALRAVLQAQGLTFIIKDKVIQAVTLDKARENLVTRAYYIGDVVSNGPFNGGALWGPVLDFQQAMGNAQVIVDSITKSIDPLIWKDKGGPATVTYHPTIGALIVRAPAEVHASLSTTFHKR